MKSPVSSAAFWIALFETVLIASVADCLPWSRSFWCAAKIPGLGVLLKLPLNYIYIFANIFAHRFSKSRYSLLFTNIQFLGSVE